MAKILIVDDDRDIHILSQALLAPHEIRCVFSVVEALECLRESPFDLILSDAGMPQLSGFDLLLTLKKNSVWKKIPVAMLTGKKDREDIQRAIRLGAQAYILKPLDPAVLVSKVEELLKSTPDDISQMIHQPQDKRHRLEVKARAEMLFQIELMSLTASDVVALSSQYFDPETIIKMESPLFREMGIFEPEFKILSVRPIERLDQEFWKLQLAWHNLDEQTQLSLEEWMSQTGNAA